MRSPASKIKKLTAVSALLLAALAATFGCAGNADETSAVSVQDATETGPAETADTQNRPFVVAEGGKCVCRIVRPVNATEAETQAAVGLRFHIMSLLPGSEVSISDDFSADGSHDPDSPEILIGMTSYPETAAVLADAGYGDAVIGVRGNKLVVLSATDSGITFLSSKLKEVLTGFQSGGGIAIDRDWGYSLKVSEPLSAIPVFDGQLPDAIHAAGDKAYEVFDRFGSPETFDDYAKKLLSSGFEMISDRTVGNNRFTSFAGKDTAVTAYYTAANHAIRVIAEPGSNYFRESGAAAEAVTTPMLTMIGRKFGTGNTYLGADANSGYMCFLLRLSDGRFIVVDGGTYDGITSFAQAIYAKMLEQAPDPKNIVIAGWFITHSHSDHTGGFVSFAGTYSDKVTLQGIFCNMPDPSDFDAAGESRNEYNRFKSAISTHYPKVPTYKIHTGQRFGIADAVFEVYYTHEDFVSQNRSVGTEKNNWNNSSLIFSVDIAGQRIMFTGDSQESPNNLTANVFGSYLKSDILQVCHHGGIGGTNSIYRAIDPEVALFTTSDALVDVYISRWAYNNFLIYSLNVKEYFNSADRITTFALPYHATGSGFKKTTEN